MADASGRLVTEGRIAAPRTESDEYGPIDCAARGGEEPEAKKPRFSEGAWVHYDNIIAISKSRQKTLAKAKPVARLSIAGSSAVASATSGGKVKAMPLHVKRARDGEAHAASEVSKVMKAWLESDEGDLRFAFAAARASQHSFALSFIGLNACRRFVWSLRIVS